MHAGGRCHGCAYPGGPHAGLLDWLREHGVDHEVHEHAQAFTAASTARAEGVDARTFAKVVGVVADDGRKALLIVDAPDRLDLHKARQVLRARDVRLLTEPELAALAPGCDAGALPAVGPVFGLPMFADYAVQDDCGDQLQRRDAPPQRARRSRRMGARDARRIRRPRGRLGRTTRVGALMTGPAMQPSTSATPITLVWIDAREAIIVRRDDGESRVERIESDVPAHHKSTGHVRHDPGVRHGGGGPPQTAGEPRRLEHLARYLEIVVDRLPPHDDLLVIGPGTVHEHLARRIAELDLRHRIVRDVACEAAPPMTRHQLQARVRRASGEAPRRRAVAWRLTRAG